MGSVPNCQKEIVNRMLLGGLSLNLNYLKISKNWNWLEYRIGFLSWEVMNFGLKKDWLCLYMAHYNWHLKIYTMSTNI